MDVATRELGLPRMEGKLQSSTNSLEIVIKFSAFCYNCFYIVDFRYL